MSNEFREMIEAFQVLEGITVEDVRNEPEVALMLIEGLSMLCRDALTVIDRTPDEHLPIGQLLQLVISAMSFASKF